MKTFIIYKFVFDFEKTSLSFLTMDIRTKLVIFALCFFSKCIFHLNSNFCEYYKFRLALSIFNKGILKHDYSQKFSETIMKKSYLNGSDRCRRSKGKH